MRETCQVRRGGCRNDDTSRHFWFATVQLIFCDYRYFRKPSKHIVSTPTFPLPSDNHPSRRNKSFRRPHPSLLTTTTATPTPYAVLSKFRLYDFSKAPPSTPFAFNGVTGVCVVLGVYTPGDMSLRKPSFTRDACGSVKHNAAGIGSLQNGGAARCWMARWCGQTRRPEPHPPALTAPMNSSEAGNAGGKGTRSH